MKVIHLGEDEIRFLITLAMQSDKTIEQMNEMNKIIIQVQRELGLVWRDDLNRFSKPS
jgi:hypothetical protein